MGLIADAFGPVAVADRRMLAPIPRGWSFAEAASVPIVFLTAYYGLVDLGRPARGRARAGPRRRGRRRDGRRQLARHLGAEVFATASPAKWDVLRDLGLDDDHIASSRDLEFRDRFLAATGGDGVDVVLNALAGEFVDASLDLLPRGGRFIEMGKADIRDAEDVAARAPRRRVPALRPVRTPARTASGEMLAELVALFEAACCATRRSRRGTSAGRRRRSAISAQARNIGKVVLTIPRAARPATAPS